MPNFATIVEVLRYRAQHQPDKTGYVFLEDGEVEAGKLTYGELDRQARAIAAELQSKGASGTRALLLYPFNAGLEFIAAFLGCLYAEVVAVTTYPPRPNQSLTGFQARADSSQTTFALATQSLWATIKGQLAQNSALAPGLNNLHWLATDVIPLERASHWLEVTPEEDTLAFLQYTSGSTGTPKGVMVTHGNLMSNQRTIQMGFGTTAQIRAVGWLPMFHDMGLIGNVLHSLYLGTPIALMSPLAVIQKPWRWLQAISTYKATVSGGPNFAYDVCTRKVTPEILTTLDLSTWEVAFCGAEPVRAETMARFAETFAPCGFRYEAFYPCYGMAETTLFISGGVKTEAPAVCYVDGAAMEEHRVVPVGSDVQGAKAIVSCGRTWLDQKIAIVDPDLAKPCPYDRVGEIWVSGSGVGQGYWQQREETERTFNAYLADTGEGPFLRTGDLGFIRDGELFVTGRLKDMMIIWGRNHYPQNIEQTVERSHPALRPTSTAAFAVSVGTEDQLVVVCEVERMALRGLDVDSTIKAIRQAVAEQHELEIYAVVLLKPGSIPKTSSGKVQRHGCRTGFLEGTLGVVGQWKNPHAEFSGVLEMLDPS